MRSDQSMLQFDRPSATVTSARQISHLKLIDEFTPPETASGPMHQTITNRPSPLGLVAPCALETSVALRPILNPSRLPISIRLQQQRWHTVVKRFVPGDQREAFNCVDTRDVLVIRRIVQQYQALADGCGAKLLRLALLHRVAPSMIHRGWMIRH